MHEHLTTRTSAEPSWEPNAIPDLHMKEETLINRIVADFEPMPQPIEIRQKPRLSIQILMLLGLTVSSMLAYWIVSRYVVTAVIVQGRSMLPTLNDGDRFLLNRWSYLFTSPHRGDLVVLRDPGHNDFAVKRVIGAPSDIIVMSEGAVYLNGARLHEEYLSPGTVTDLPEGRPQTIRLGENEYFVLGDNRGNSEDSRIYGKVERFRILGMISK